MITCATPAHIFADIPAALPTELFQTLVKRDGIQIERIVSNGHASQPGSWYDQTWDEWILLLSGSAGLLCEGQDGEQRLSAGDYLIIPAGCRHRVLWTDPGVPTVWLAVHFGRPEI